ncbi:class I SAM-dependent methyltransferase family protein [Candidatus Woesearchaeota archaeon]|nr:class I SAM-dependent methyltransferase family protein [Candidatus Woesearchaeota archaeon]
MKLREALQGKIPASKLAQLKTAFDSVGSIAILEIDDDMKKYQRSIAKALLSIQKNIKTVVKKKGIHEGALRLQKVAWLGGKRTKETVHVESGVRLLLDIEKVYFSVRLGTERLRIAQQVKPGEEVLVMFSGCAPYPCVLAKHTKAKEIVGIELNPAGHEYGLQNVALNKIKNVTLIHGDVRKAVPELHRTFDRIIMPLPHGADDFLDVAFSAAKKGAVIHFYDFLEEKDIPDAAVNKIKAAAARAKKKVEILHWNRCGSNAPRTWRVCVDVKVVIEQFK